MKLVAGAVSIKERRGQMIDVAMVAALESIVGTSTCENFKQPEFKVQQFFDAPRVERECLGRNLCEHPRHVTS